MPGTENAEFQFFVALLLIKQYEDLNYPIPFPYPIDAIKQKMEEHGLKNKDLVGIVGSKGFISAILNKKKPLILELERLFHREFGICSKRVLRLRTFYCIFTHFLPTLSCPLFLVNYFCITPIRKCQGF